MNATDDVWMSVNFSYSSDDRDTWHPIRADSLVSGILWNVTWNTVGLAGTSFANDTFLMRERI